MLSPPFSTELSGRILINTESCRHHSSPEHVVHQSKFVAGHPGGESEEPELSGDDRGELGQAGGDHEGGGEGDVLPDTAGARPRHGAHELGGDGERGER